MTRPGPTALALLLALSGCSAGVPADEDASGDGYGDAPVERADLALDAPETPADSGLDSGAPGDRGLDVPPESALVDRGPDRVTTDTAPEAASDRPTTDVPRDGGVEGGTGTSAGNFWNTYYYLALESDYTGAADTTLYTGSCAALARVPAAFSDAVCVEGSGRLRDGRVINYSSSCTCGRRCPTGGIVCYASLDPVRFPWGAGARSNALVPLRSWATDRASLPTGTVVYAPRWDGLAIPSVDGLGGFVHDGCFRADDVGGAITGNHVDVFAGSRNLWRQLERLIPTRTSFEVRRGASRCAWLGG